MAKHVHAELMAQYAQDALITDKPWELWEYTIGNCGYWPTCTKHPEWHESSTYRRKPQKKKYVKLEVPVPVKEEDLLLNERYWIVNEDVTYPFYAFREVHHDIPAIKKALSENLVGKTKFEAALLSYLKNNLHTIIEE